MRKIHIRMGVTTAANVILLFSCLYFINWQMRIEDESLATIPIVDISSPNSNGATITLSNRKTLSLSDHQKGIVIGDGSLKYEDGSKVEGSSSHGYDKLAATTALASSMRIFLFCSALAISALPAISCCHTL
ncbi:MAG: hypothetical protein LBE37_09325 [Sphingobacterium sp.]|nr:hypothetical protein [Sphingobacterium sp.]